MKRRKILRSDSVIRMLFGGIIICLSVYVTVKCVAIITKGQGKERIQKSGKYISNVLAREIVENSDVMNQYMLCLENHRDLSEVAKAELLKAVVTEYIDASEYSYDTTDPGYNQVINLIYENMNASTTVEATTRQERVTEHQTSEIGKKKTTHQKLVPEPKSVGKRYTAKNLGGFYKVIEKFYTVTASTAMYESDLPITKALNEKFRITGDGKKPQILIYHTHSQEEFSNSTGNPNTTIIGVGNRLAEVLEKQYGYRVIHDTSTYDIVHGKLDRNEAYDQSRAGVKRLLKKYPSISLCLDIHRDGVGENTRLITEINGKKTAQIMLFNGMSRFKITGDIDYLYNPYRFENLALTLQMKLKAEEFYPGFTRRNYVNAYQYNLDICRQTMLIEVGAQTNTYQEAQNAAEPMAVLIHKVLGNNKREQ
ncbi:MAG: stage II sporulation protein P [Eubacterium sp.]|nr:stage II sporulation protein P [Eubacterium sp.]